MIRDTYGTDLRGNIARMFGQAMNAGDGDEFEYADRILALPEIKEWYDAWWREESHSNIYDSPD